MYIGPKHYTEQLEKLESFTPVSKPCLPEALLEITTPLIGSVWEQELASHPDKKLATYVTNGIRRGFRVGFDRHRLLTSCRKNLISATEHPQVVSDYLEQELALNHMVPMPPVDFPCIHCHISPFGVIPKKSKPGKWRLIVDLSSPSNASVNDGIDKDMCSISYITTDAIVDQVLSNGQGSLMAKVDIKQAYRMIPVHPDDRLLLAVQWQGDVIVDKVLPFGLRSAPLIFTAVADALQWIMLNRNVTNVAHYLDDFITIGPPDSLECKSNLDSIVATCQYTGTPLEIEKSEGPTPIITFLGLEIDSIKMEIRLPAAKLERLQAMLKDWKGKKAGRKRDLLSLIGYLHHACKAIRQGRSFLRRLINLSTVVKSLDAYVRLNLSARSDIRWWSVYARQWNGISMMAHMEKGAPQQFVISDASGSWGCVAYHNQFWFQLQWPVVMEDCHISIKEMIPIVIAATLWGNRWSGQSVRFRSDNSAVVAVVNSGSSK